MKMFVRAIVLAALGLSACAKERDPIDRVQPNYLDKSQLEGVWYYQRTVTDMPASNGLTFVGSYGQMHKIKFDVQENFLYARRSYELIKNADTLAVDGERYDGEVVAAFRIESHFDIQRAYNSATGEEMNVIEENTRDRPWYERRYIRVDWSQNLAPTNDFDLDSATAVPVPYFVQEIDPNTGKRHPDAPHFEEDGSYFDITTKLYAQSGFYDYPGYGLIPLCWLDEFIECGQGEYTIRNSFLKVDGRPYYEPRPYKGKETDVFGFFWTDRLVYDPVTGIRQQARERYLNRHNIWAKTTDSQGNVLPMNLRTAKPIVYHLNTDWPTQERDPVMWAAAHDVANSWNQVYLDVVEAAGAEAPIINGEPRMFVLCDHNPVQEGDPDVCGEPGTVARVGDIRYSFIAFVPEYMTYGLLGLGPSNTDPETGEIISGMAYMYSLNDGAANTVTEMIELLNGDISPTDYIDGMDLTSWINTVRGNGNERASRTYSLEDAQFMVEKIANGPAAQFFAAERRAPTPADEEFQKTYGVDAWLAPRFEQFAERRVVRTESVGQQRLAKLAGSELESKLMIPDLGLAMGMGPDMVGTEDWENMVSIARGGFLLDAKERQKILEKFADERNMYLPSMADDALLGLAKELADQNLTRQEVYDVVRKSVYTAVTAHEVGHSLGLMHNFGGSDDAINYFDDYWTIRSADGTVAPRLVDPITDEEIDSKIYNYAYSSIMDYAGRYTIDGMGPGKYDRAAMLFGYANKVEVFKNRHGIPAADFREWFESQGDPLYFYNSGPEAIHYTTYYNEMGDDLFDPSNRELVDVSELSDDYATTQDGDARVPYIYCSHNRSDLGDSCLTRDFGADAMERMDNIIEELNTWYIQRAFLRGRVGVESWNYINRTYRFFYDRFKQWHDIYGLYKDFLPLYYTPAQLEEFFSNPETGWGTKTWAIQNAFNALVQTIMMPEVSEYYGPLTTADGSVVLDKYAGDGTGVSLDVVDGRYFQTGWDAGDDSGDCGYMFWECMHHFGFYLDKIMAIYAMSDSQTNFVGRATPEDIREWEVSYYSTFSDQIAKINEAIMDQKWEQVGPYYENGQLKFPNYAGDLSETHCSTGGCDVDAEIVDPMATFTIQLYWQVLGYAFFANNFDQRFQNESQIFIAGTGEEPDVDPSQLVSYTNPFNHRTYTTVKSLTGRGGGEALLERANRLLARSTYCDDAANTPSFPDDDCVAPSGDHTPESVSAQLASLNEYIEAIVQMRRMMDYGNPFYP